MSIKTNKAPKGTIKSVKEELAEIIMQQKEIFPDIIGLKNVKKQIKSAILSSHHIILIGPPGTGKTTIAKDIALLLNSTSTKKPKSSINEFTNPAPTKPDDISMNEKNPNAESNLDDSNSSKSDVKTVTSASNTSLSLIENNNPRFVRVQGSPDLTVEDLIGDIDPTKAFKYGASSLEAFIPGKIFKANRGVLFFDELNRCPQKLQNALLQVLEEGFATLSNYNVDFKTDFFLIGTMNPEDSASEELSDVFQDRVDMIYVGYPDTIDDEMKIVLTKGKKICDFPERLIKTILIFIRDLRKNKQLEKKPSVRASISLYERSQANAILNNRNKVNIDDIREALTSVLSHRIKLKPSVEYTESEQDFIKKLFDELYTREMKSSERESGDSG